MILTDTGPLVALHDPRDAYHARCIAAVKALPSGPMVTTWPCLTETLYLLGQAGGWAYQQRLLSLYQRHVVRLYTPDDADVEMERITALMDTYEDAGCDFADASLVACAQALSVQRVFTLDSHFFAYRLPGGDAFEVVPDLR